VQAIARLRFSAGRERRVGPERSGDGLDGIIAFRETSGRSQWAMTNGQ
jgi:hypothetical protein